MIKALLLAMPDTLEGFDKSTFLPNLGIVSLAGNVDPNICDVKVADLIFAKHRLEDYVLDLLRTCSPDLVGLSCMSFEYHNAVKLVEIIKNYDKNILTVMGGYHPTLMFEEISASPEARFIDFIVRGEGETTFNELTTAIDAGRNYDKIAGLSYKASGVFHHNPSRGLLLLSDIQMPRRDARLIKKGFHCFGLTADVIETSRGCTYNCKFCSIRRMYGRSFRTYEINRVIADIRDAYEHGARSLLLADDNITLDLVRFEALCDEIIAAKLNSIHYSVQASVSGIAHSEKLVRKMADAGVKIVFLGIESESKEILDALRKKTSTPEEAKKAAKYLRDNGIINFGGLIVGNPDDDEAALWRAFDTAWNLKVDAPFFLVLTPHAKTEIREELMAQELVTNPDDFSTYDQCHANVRTKHLSPEEIDRIVEEMYRKYVGNLRYMKFTQARKVYPKYFLKLVLKALPAAIIDSVKRKLSKRVKVNSLLSKNKQAQHEGDKR